MQTNLNSLYVNLLNLAQQAHNTVLDVEDAYPDLAEHLANAVTNFQCAIAEIEDLQASVLEGIEDDDVCVFDDDFHIDTPMDLCDDIDDGLYEPYTF